MDEESLFQKVMTIESSADQARYLEQACGDDAELRRNVESLVDSYRAAGNFLEKSPAVELRGVVFPQVEGFRIIRCLSFGGMGVVFEAFDERLERTVALKTLHREEPGTSPLARRFRREATITSRLQHPGIVPVYAAADALGKPCYVMRLIQGETLAERIRQYHEASAIDDPWTLRQLLQAFVSVCRTVDFAHAQNVLHRDIKPANVMIGHFGETLVLDWGLARQISPSSQAAAGEASSATPFAGNRVAADDSATVLNIEEIDRKMSTTIVIDDGPTDPVIPGSEGDLTQLGLAMGTPAYMAPEQARGESDRIGPAVDIFSLGATLFSMLTGKPPLKGTQLECLASARTRSALSPRVADARIAHELDAVVRKATAAEPHLRYASAGELADDVERWLADEPVLAYREPWTARLSRWQRRHRMLVRSALAIFFTVCLAAVIGTFAVMHEHEQTLRAEYEVESSNRASAAIRDVLENMFRTVDPTGLNGRGFRTADQPASEVTAHQLLDAGAREISTKLSDQPEVQAALFATLGDTYRGLGDFADAERYLTSSLELRKQHLGDDHLDVARSMFLLGILKQDVGKYPDSERLLRGAHERAVKHLGSDALEVARIEFQLAYLITQQPLTSIDELHRTRDRMVEAHDLLKHVVAVRKEKLGPTHKEVGLSLAALAGTSMARREADESKKLLLEAFAILDRPENADPMGSAMAHFIAGEAFRNLSRFDDAVQSHQKVVEIVKRQLGEQHVVYAMVLGNLAGTQRQQGDMAGAEESIRKHMHVVRNSPLRANPGVVDIFLQVADGLVQRGDLDEARAIYREALTFCGECGAACDPLAQRARERLAALTPGPESTSPSETPLGP